MWEGGELLGYFIDDFPCGVFGFPVAATAHRRNSKSVSSAY